MRNISVSNLNYVDSIPENSWIAYSPNIYSEMNILHVTLDSLEGVCKFIYNDGEEEIETVEAKILRLIWQNMQNKFQGSVLKDCCVKPDKFHGIILIDEKINGNHDKILAKVISEFKSRSTKLIGIYTSNFGKVLWENGFKKEVIPTYAELYGLVNFAWRNEL